VVAWKDVDDSLQTLQAREGGQVHCCNARALKAQLHDGARVHGRWYQGGQDHGTSPALDLLLNRVNQYGTFTRRKHKWSAAYALFAQQRHASCTFTHIHIHIHFHIHTCCCSHARTHTHAQTCTDTCTDTYTFAQQRMHTNTAAHMHTCTRSIAFALADGGPAPTMGAPPACRASTRSRSVTGVSSTEKQSPCCFTRRLRASTWARALPNGCMHGLLRTATLRRRGRTSINRATSDKGQLHGCKKDACRRHKRQYGHGSRKTSRKTDEKKVAQGTLCWVGRDPCVQVPVSLST
jgi:hypothetical protein